jgi:DNA-directed RNA polymerase specialized sigma24 family protein
MSKAKAQPRALIHRNILDVAEEHPDASIEKLASEVSAATPDLVERVLDEYGDPSNTPSGDQTTEPTEVEDDQATDVEDDQATDVEDDQATEGTSPEAHQPLRATFGDLTPAQRKTLEAIRKHPSATQRELGEQLDVSSATICTHVNSIEGFEWTDRERFVETVMPETRTQPDGGGVLEEQRNETQTKEAGKNQEAREGIVEVRERLTQVEKRLERLDTDSDSHSEDPELIHKIIHACMTSESITKDEELKIIQNLT